MRKFFMLAAAVAAFGLFAVPAPADAATRKAAGVANAQSVQMDLSARRYYRHYYYQRHYRYYGRHYGAPYYYRPYYYRPYPYYYGPRYYYPYGYYPYYYRRPGIYLQFGW